MSLTAQALMRDLKRSGTPTRATTMEWFFKTGVGEYGHGDVFIGTSVPRQRQLAAIYRALALPELSKLFRSKVHEHRLTAVFILVDQFRRAHGATRHELARYYLKQRHQVNNWDLVDSSAPQILGVDLLDKPKTVLTKLARSTNIWDRRIAIMATQTFIREGRYTETLKLARLMLKDPEDLIHKAVGWMLREIGDRHRQVEEKFLRRHAPVMPRTMLRYAIEKFPTADRKKYLRRKSL